MEWLILLVKVCMIFDGILFINGYMEKIVWKRSMHWNKSKSA
jgi:hypothetical protein